MRKSGKSDQALLDRVCNEKILLQGVYLDAVELGGQGVSGTNTDGDKSFAVAVKDDVGLL